MSPLAIQIMLHCYCSNEPWWNVMPKIWNSDAAANVREDLIELGLIDENFQVTEPGKQFVESLLSLSSAICRNVSRRDHQMTERRDSHPGLGE